MGGRNYIILHWRSGWGRREFAYVILDKYAGVFKALHALHCPRFQPMKCFLVEEFAYCPLDVVRPSESQEVRLGGSTSNRRLVDGERVISTWATYD